MITTAMQATRKKLVPFGERYLVRRKMLKDVKPNEGSIVLTQEIEERLTEMAEVRFVPMLTEAEKALIEAAPELIAKMTKFAKEGDSEAYKTLQNISHLLRLRTIRPGDMVMISKYVGIEYYEPSGGETLTVVNGEDIIGVVRDI